MKGEKGGRSVYNITNKTKKEKGVKRCLIGVLPFAPRWPRRGWPTVRIHESLVLCFLCRHHGSTTKITEREHGSRALAVRVFIVGSLLFFPSLILISV